MVQPCGNRLMVPLTAKHRANLWLRISTHRYIPKRKGIQTSTCVQMTREALFKTVKKWKEPRSFFLEEWISKTRSIHIMEYYSAIKKTRLQIQVTTQMNLENIMLSEINRQERLHRTRLYLHEICKIFKTLKTENKGRKGNWPEYENPIKLKVGGLRISIKLIYLRR